MMTGFMPNQEEIHKALFNMLARGGKVPYIDWAAYEIVRRIPLDHYVAISNLFEDATRENIGEEKVT